MLRSTLTAAAAVLLGGCTAPAPSPYPVEPAYHPAASSASARILQLHNAERARTGVLPVSWDPTLAAAAQSYAARLAPRHRLVHSSKAERGRTGENLWMGTRGAYSVDDMVGSWTAERRHFRPGTFPRVSRTGNWTDVGHYTAMTWPTTTRIGCGISASGNNEVLVCRYAPNGNIDGRRVP